MASSTMRSLLLVSLLVSCFCMTTVTASRSLEETNKLSLGVLDTPLLAKLLHSNHGLINVAISVDLSGILHPVELLLKDAVGDWVNLKVVVGLVTKLEKPIVVKVKDSDGTLYIIVKALGKKVLVPVKLSELNPVLETVGDLDVLHVVVKLVETVEKEVNVVLHIVNSVTGKVLGLINGIL